MDEIKINTKMQNLEKEGKQTKRGQISKHFSIKNHFLWIEQNKNVMSIDLVDDFSNARCIIIVKAMYMIPLKYYIS